MRGSGLDRPTTLWSRSLALAPWFLFLVLGLALFRTQGHYAFHEIAFTALAVCPAGVGMLRPASDRISERGLWVLGAAGLVLFAGLMSTSSRLMYTRPGDALLVLHGASLLTLVASIAIFVAAVSSYGHASVRTRIRELSAVAVCCLLLGQVMTILASPRPIIDVWTITTSATDHLLAGRNPYAQGYEDIYRGAYDYKPGVSYLPLLFYWVAPFRWLLGDIRYAFIAADLGTGMALVWLARRRGLPRTTWLVFPLLWLAFPVVFFVLEQAWIDTLLVLFVALLAIALEGRRFLLVGLWMGCLMAVKQYALLVVLITAFVVLRHHGVRAFSRVCGVALGTFLALLLPFLAVDARSFYAGTVTRVASFGFRDDSFSLVAMLKNEWGWLPPPGVSLAATATAVVLVCLWLHHQSRLSLRDWSAALALVYLAFFLTAKQSFCNYYFLVAGFLVMHLVCDASERMVSSPLSPRRRRRPAKQTGGEQLRS